MSDLRCRACEIFGGTVVESDAEAAELSEIPRIRLQLAVQQRTLRAQDRITVPHCLDSGRAIAFGDVEKPHDFGADPELASFRRQYGRPCPRVVLEPDNYIPATLVWMSLSENARHFVGPLFEAHYGRAPAETRAEILVRVYGSLSDREVTEKLYPPPKEGKPSRARPR